MSLVTVYFNLYKNPEKGGGGMLSDRIGAKARGLQDQPPLSVAEKLLLLVCAAALVFACAAGYTELDRQSKARTALTQVKAAQLAARAVAAQCYAAGVPYADQTSRDGFAAGIAEEIETLGSLPGTVTLLQVSADGYTVQQLLYAEGEMRALYDAETGYTVWRAEPRLRFDSGVNP